MQLRFFRARGTPKSDVSSDILTGGDVATVDDGHDMGVRMGDVVAGEHERNALSLAKISQDWRQPLAEGENLLSDDGGNGVEVGEVLTGDDQYMSGSYRPDIEKGDDVLRLVDEMRRDFARSDPTEQTLASGCHLCLVFNFIRLQQRPTPGTPSRASAQHAPHGACKRVRVDSCLGVDCYCVLGEQRPKLLLLHKHG